MEIVLSERDWVEEKIFTHSLGDQPWLTLKRLAIYYCEQGYKKPEVQRRLEDFVLRCDSGANLLDWSDTIKEAVDGSGARKLLNIEGIPITRGELDVVASSGGIINQKVLFALLCLAKYKNIVRPHNNGWVSSQVPDIFSLANITLSCVRQCLVINNLCHLGFLGVSKRVNNTDVRVNFVDDESEQVLFISDFRNLGNQYLMATRKDYIECAECGLVVKKKSNHQRYCRSCANKMRKIAMLSRRRDVYA